MENDEKSMKKEDKRDYNYKPRFKPGDVIVRNDKWHNSFSRNLKSEYVNPYHIPFVSTLTIHHINISEFSNFILKGYVFEEQQHSYDSTIVDIEYDLFEDIIRAKKISDLKKCITQNTKKVMQS